MQLIGPGADHPVLGRGPVVDLVLEDVVASRGVSVLIEDHGCASTPCGQRRKYSSGDTEQQECLEKNERIFTRNKTLNYLGRSDAMFSLPIIYQHS